MKRPLKFGICLDGCEEAMELHLRKVATRFDRVQYLEIGTAQGATLTSMASILHDCCQFWSAVGLDLPNGYSLVLPLVESNAVQHGLRLRINRSFDGANEPDQNVVTVNLKNSQDFLRENWCFPIHFAFIDGCHGKPCVKADFELCEQWIPEGGIAVFHDFGPDSRGEPQPHCGIGDTYGACEELGLLDGSRKNWKYLGNVVADKSKIGRDIGIFQKIA